MSFGSGTLLILCTGLERVYWEICDFYLVIILEIFFVFANENGFSIANLKICVMAFLILDCSN